MFDSILMPPPQRWRKLAARLVLPEEITVFVPAAIADDDPLWTLLRDDASTMLKRPVRRVDDASSAGIVLGLHSPRDEQAGLLPPGGYRLLVDAQRISLDAETDAALFHGVQTLTQLLAIERRAGVVQQGVIHDWPDHAERWFMLDLGRGLFPLPYLQQIIRLLARLKYNGVHLHVCDNELNSIRYDGLPLGREHPHPLTLADVDALRRYAQQYRLKTMVEIESWGHAGAILQHYPEVYGATRPHGYGHSFGIGPAWLELLEKIYDQWAAVLPDGSDFHVGLDEANWRLLPGADPQQFNRQTLVSQIHRLLTQRTQAHGKQFRMLLWGGGIKHPDVHVPAELRDNVVMLPWHYATEEGVHQQLLRHWVRDLKRFNERGQMRSPFISGGGNGGIHEFGAVEATMHWGVKSLDYPNCLGVEVMQWGTNDIAGRMLSMYHGSASAWNPLAAQKHLTQEMALPIPREQGVGMLGLAMRNWQFAYPDADHDNLNRARGPEVLMGKYRGGPQHDEPVAGIWMPQTMYRGDQDK